MPTSIPRAAAAGSGFAVAAKAHRASVSRASESLLLLDTDGFPPYGRQHPPEPFLELDLRLPPEQLLGAGDVGLADLRIVDGQCFEHDFAVGRGHSDDCLRELENGELARVAEVHGQVLAALGEQVQPTDHVDDVAEAARLRSVAEDGDRLVLER